MTENLSPKGEYTSFWVLRRLILSSFDDGELDSDLSGMVTPLGGTLKTRRAKHLGALGQTDSVDGKDAVPVFRVEVLEELDWEHLLNTALEAQAILNDESFSELFHLLHYKYVRLGRDGWLEAPSAQLKIMVRKDYNSTLIGRGRSYKVKSILDIATQMDPSPQELSLPIVIPDVIYNRSGNLAIATLLGLGLAPVQDANRLSALVENSFEPFAKGLGLDIQKEGDIDRFSSEVGWKELQNALHQVVNVEHIRSLQNRGLLRGDGENCANSEVISVDEFLENVCWWLKEIAVFDFKRVENERRSTLVFPYKEVLDPDRLRGEGTDLIMDDPGLREDKCPPSEFFDHLLDVYIKYLGEIVGSDSVMPQNFKKRLEAHTKKLFEVIERACIDVYGGQEALSEFIERNDNGFKSAIIVKLVQELDPNSSWKDLVKSVVKFYRTQDIEIPKALEYFFLAKEQEILEPVA